MNPDTNHLMRLREDEQPPTNYLAVPESLNRAARRALGQRNEMSISRTSGGKLSRWAAKQRRIRG